MRITVPEGHIALVMTKEAGEGLKATCFLLRRNKKPSTEERKFLHGVAGEILLAVIEAEQ